MSNDIPTSSKRSLFAEMIGPAGVGKTTLVNALVSSGNNVAIASKPRLLSTKDASFFVRNFIDLWPIFSLQRPGNSWLTKREIWWMLFLNNWNHALERSISPNIRLNLFDHGPIYMLTSLREFGPAVTRTWVFQQWWNRALKQWASFLDIVIWLDAPNPILATRINLRKTEHPIKRKTDDEAFAFLSQYRGALRQVISLVDTLENKLHVLQFQTDQETPDQIKGKILSAARAHFIEISQAGN